MPTSDLCVLTIDNTMMEDEGQWICHLMSECEDDRNDQEMTRKCSHMTTYEEQDSGVDCQKSEVSQSLHLKVAMHDVFAVISGQVLGVLKMHFKPNFQFLSFEFEGGL